MQHYKTVYLHRIIAEQAIGRKLQPAEVVHHLDEDKTNNSPENLVICSSFVHRQYHRKSLQQKLESVNGVPLIQVDDLWF